jgi:hypothetical protein
MLAKSMNNCDGVFWILGSEFGMIEPNMSESRVQVSFGDSVCLLFKSP